MKNIKKEWLNHKITLWQKLKLLFVKPIVSVDYGKSDQTVVSCSKIINDKFYFYIKGKKLINKEENKND